jgi:hypothetical protein
MDGIFPRAHFIQWYAHQLNLVIKQAYSTVRENKFRKTFEKMEGFSFATPVTGLNRPNTEKEDDDDDSTVKSVRLSLPTYQGFLPCFRRI